MIVIGIAPLIDVHQFFEPMSEMGLGCMITR
jgi:hypothetical protein